MEVCALERAPKQSSHPVSEPVQVRTSDYRTLLRTVTAHIRAVRDGLHHGRRLFDGDLPSPKL